MDSTTLLPLPSQPKQSDPFMSDSCLRAALDMLDNAVFAPMSEDLAGDERVRAAWRTHESSSS